MAKNMAKLFYCFVGELASYEIRYLVEETSKESIEAKWLGSSWLPIVKCEERKMT